MVHTGTGWHFVLPGGTGLTSFTANFQTAGAVTVTTTETATGVIVQDGKGAVIYTNTADTLVDGAGGYPGQGTAATAGNNDMQLSHICTGTPTTPPSTAAGHDDHLAAGTRPRAGPVAPTTAKASPSTSVQAAKKPSRRQSCRRPARTCRSAPALAISLGLLLGGAALMFGSGRVAAGQGQARRH